MSSIIALDTTRTNKAQILCTIAVTCAAAGAVAAGAAAFATGFAFGRRAEASSRAHQREGSDAQQLQNSSHRMVTVSLTGPTTTANAQFQPVVPARVVRVPAVISSSSSRANGSKNPTSQHMSPHRTLSATAMCGSTGAIGDGSLCLEYSASTATSGGLALDGSLSGHNVTTGSSKARVVALLAHAGPMAHDGAASAESISMASSCQTDGGPAHLLMSRELSAVSPTLLAPLATASTTLGRSGAGTAGSPAGAVPPAPLAADSTTKQLHAVSPADTTPVVSVEDPLSVGERPLGGSLSGRVPLHRASLLSIPTSPRVDTLSLSGRGRGGVAPFNAMTPVALRTFSSNVGRQRTASMDSPSPEGGPDLGLLSNSVSQSNFFGQASILLRNSGSTRSAVYHSSEGGILSDAMESADARTRLPKWPIWRVCVTGGPCSGKSTSMPIIKAALEAVGFRVYIVPEVATILINGGLEFSNMTDDKRINQQKVILQTIMMLEDSFYELASGGAQQSVILCDRGTLDGSAYCSKEEFEKILNITGYTIAELRDARYDAIVHLVTTAIGCPDLYTTANNTARRETVAEAADLDRRTREKWSGHRMLGVFDNMAGFDAKVRRVVDFIMRMAHVRPTIPSASSSESARPKEGISLTPGHLMMPCGGTPTDAGPNTARTGVPGQAGRTPSRSTMSPSSMTGVPTEGYATDFPDSPQTPARTRTAASIGNNDADGNGVENISIGISAASAMTVSRTTHNTEAFDTNTTPPDDVDAGDTLPEGSPCLFELCETPDEPSPNDLSTSSAVLSALKSIEVTAIHEDGLPANAVETEYLIISLTPSEGFKAERILRQRTAGGCVVESKRSDTGETCNDSVLYFYVAERQNAFDASITDPSVFRVPLGAAPHAPLDATMPGQQRSTTTAGAAECGPLNMEAGNVIHRRLTEKEFNAIRLRAIASSYERKRDDQRATKAALAGEGGRTCDGGERCENKHKTDGAAEGHQEIVAQVRKVHIGFFCEDAYFTLVKYDAPARMKLLVPFDFHSDQLPRFLEYRGRFSAADLTTA